MQNSDRCCSWVLQCREYRLLARASASNPRVSAGRSSASRPVGVTAGCVVVDRGRNPTPAARGLTGCDVGTVMVAISLEQVRGGASGVGRVADIHRAACGRPSGSIRPHFSRHYWGALCCENVSFWGGGREYGGVKTGWQIMASPNIVKIEIRTAKNKQERP